MRVTKADLLSDKVAEPEGLPKGDIDGVVEFTGREGAGVVVLLGDAEDVALMVRVSAPVREAVSVLVTAAVRDTVDERVPFDDADGDKVTEGEALGDLDVDGDDDTDEVSVDMFCDAVGEGVALLNVEKVAPRERDGSSVFEPRDETDDVDDPQGIAVRVDLSPLDVGVKVAAVDGVVLTLMETDRAVDRVANGDTEFLDDLVELPVAETEMVCERVADVEPEFERLTREEAENEAEDVSVDLL